MSQHWHEVQDELRDPVKELRAQIPETWHAYATLHRHALEAGHIDAKTKELIALAVAVTTQCDGCIASHARGAARQGATAEEVAEALGVVVLLTGGPGTVYGPRAYQAFLEFREDYRTAE
ncbi:alkylhydroperoxidase like protein, AhpD family [Acidimicrobium ferrooxidans DSM 10331]|uniref:Alkylhydroperoxidase like protein, AhpD family n=1 Tax=Acidimicrobium ferrooxidans (strain DSM 10331 / JCM 15462 / NBRC 103882 / ICP) TaxID=525909 RepID=C7LY49_ACIFD|nr:carboxymuconolactone decarboxylase family protein [Acidimicrobium ferrooxidans]ACU53657.1 alkylhydroperoxidase like protein, AhpD family [Acidimicrobium ferrooxidans DSM 10331]